MKKTEILLYAIIACSLSFVSCEQLEDGTDEESLDIITGIDTSELVIDISGGGELVKVVDFYATESWSITIEGTTKADSDSWVSVSPMSGAAGSAQITITISENSTTDPRSATVSITTASLDSPIAILLTQEAGDDDDDDDTIGGDDIVDTDSGESITPDSPTVNDWNSDDESLDVEITKQ